ncbi:MAG: DMT family transporter [Thiothrix sp.]|nr:DMT family transporter [Thiothrix sp.]HPE59957.1 DMT family transporter [Thiolinea sp.]
MGLLWWMAGALASFCLMAVGGRELSSTVDTFQILFVRSMVGLLVVTVIILSLRQYQLFRTGRIGLHMVRNLVHLGGQYGWFLGIGLMPLVQVFAIEFTVPFWTAIIAALFLHESLSWRKSLAILLGLTGVAIIVKPGADILQSVSLIVLLAAICYAVCHSATKALARTEKPLTILFYMCIIQLPLAFVLALPGWQPIQGWSWFWLVIVGLSALSAHYCLTRAMQEAEVGIVVTLDFLRLPLIGLVGVMLYGEALEWSLLVGGLLMLFGNWLNISRPAPVKDE